MKKILIVCMLCFGLSASASNNKLAFSDLNYVFDYSIDKCKSQEFKFKKFIFEEYNNGTIIVTKTLSSIIRHLLIL